MDKLVLASGNAGKLKELSSLLAPLGIEVLPQSAFNVSEAEEPHPSFLENAIAKARHAARATGLPALADDSGLCVEALEGLVKAGKLPANPMRDFVAAISVGIYKGVPVLDLDYPEDSDCETDMNVVMTGAGGFVEVQGTAEGTPFSRAELDALLELAGDGIAQLVIEQKKALGIA